MGFIYRLSSPKGKSYIGQTIKTCEHRWDQHRTAAARDSDERCCHALNRAIRKYGWDNFKKEILVECDNDMLNYYEIKFIDLFGSFPPPGGYNLTPGGAGCVFIQTDEIKEKRSNSLRKPERAHLPMYVKVRKTKSSTGYMVEKPGYAVRTFCSPKQTDEEKLAGALEYIGKIDSGEILPGKKFTHYKFDFDVPKYMSYIKSCNGFTVKIPGKKSRTFGGKKLSLEEKYQLALTYMKSLEIADKVEPIELAEPTEPAELTGLVGKEEIDDEFGADESPKKLENDAVQRLDGFGAEEIAEDLDSLKI